MNNDILRNVFEVNNSPNSPEILLFVIALVLSVLFSYLLRYFYINFWNTIADKENISSNFVLLTLIITIIITVVKSSLALSLGLVGALSIVRFRTPIKDPEELIFLFIIFKVSVLKHCTMDLWMLDTIQKSGMHQAIHLVSMW